MYSLVVLLSILASASFVLAFVRGERRHVVWLGVWMTLLLYTHTWGVFLAAAMAGAWLVLLRRGRGAGRPTARGSARCSRWCTCRGCPCCSSRPRTPRRRGPERPSALSLLGVPGGLFGYVALPLLALAVFFARRPLEPASRVLLGDRRGDGGARLAVLADRARVGDPLPRGRARPAAARAGVGGREGAALDRAGAGGRGGRLADERSAADQEQRADGLDELRAVDPPRRRRRLHPARAGARRCTATCRRASSTSRRWDW